MNTFHLTDHPQSKSTENNVMQNRIEQNHIQQTLNKPLCINCNNQGHPLEAKVTYGHSLLTANLGNPDLDKPLVSVIIHYRNSTT